MQRKLKGAKYGDAIENPMSGAFERFRNENNELFEEVRHDREGALDGKKNYLFASIAKKLIPKLIQLPAHDAGCLVTKFSEEGSSSVDPFDWRS